MDATIQNGIALNPKSILTKVDTTPTADSNNPVSSDGVKTYVDQKDQATNIRVDTLNTQIAASFFFKGSSTFAELPASGNTVNDTYYVTDSDKECWYSWNGTDWIKSSMSQADYAGLIAQLKADISAEYSTSKTYKVGDYCLYGADGVLYICKIAVTTAGAFDSNKWQAISFGEAVGDLVIADDTQPTSFANKIWLDTDPNLDTVEVITEEDLGNIVAGEFDSASAYAVGDYCIHDAKLYVAKTATAANDGWIAARWQQVTVMGTINDQVGELKIQLHDDKEWAYNNLVALDNGNLLVNGSWSLGNISTSGNLYVGDSYKNRVISTAAIKLAVEATLKIDSGYRVKIAYYSSPNLQYGAVANPDFISITSFTTESITISANTWFDIMIAQETDPETADIETFVNAVHFDSTIDSRLTALETSTEQIDIIKTDIANIKAEQAEQKEWLYKDLTALDNGKLLLNAEWSLGNISNGGNLYVGEDYQKRVISLTAMKLPEASTLKIDSGYKVKIAYYYTPELKYDSGENPNLISMTAFTTDSITINADTWFDILIAQDTDPALADIETFSHAVYFDSLINTRLTMLENTDEFLLPSYWTNYLNTKYPTLREKDALIGAGGDSFVFITDVHIGNNTKKSPGLIHSIIKNTAVKKAFTDGDVLDEGDSKATAYEKLSTWQSMMDGVRNYNIPGNHDNNNYDGNNAANAITGGEYYGIMTKPAEDWTDTNGKLYYCVDNESQKIRYICLAIDGFSRLSTDATQQAWFITKLTELDSSWSIIVFQHRIWHTSTTTPHERGQEVIDVINNNWNSIHATLIAIIAGHSHLDYSTTEPTHGYLLIACNCDTLSGTSSGYTRTAGTTSEQSFDVFHLDKTHAHLYATRIGAGTDRDWSYT